MADDVVINKVAMIERCVERVREVDDADDRNLWEDVTRQDSILLNLQLTCEAAIDLAMHIVRVRRLGVPQETRQAFELLRDAALLPAELAERMMRMVGFRNIAIHNYQRLNLEIVKTIVTAHLDDFLAFGAAMLRLASPRSAPS